MAEYAEEVVAGRSGNRRLRGIGGPGTSRTRQRKIKSRRWERRHRTKESVVGLEEAAKADIEVASTARGYRDSDTSVDVPRWTDAGDA